MAQNLRHVRMFLHLKDVKMKRVVFASALLLAMLMTGCAPALRVYHDLDSQTDFSAYKTFSFSDWTDGNKKTINQMELGRIRAAVQNEMESRGLKFVESGGDLKVAVTVYHREAVSGSSYPYGYYYYYGPYSGGNYHYIERAITVDLYDATSDKQIWHSAVVGEIERDPERRAADFPRAAELLFRDYPEARQI